jgi:hypothetical protein
MGFKIHITIRIVIVRLTARVSQGLSKAHVASSRVWWRGWISRISSLLLTAASSAGIPCFRRGGSRLNPFFRNHGRIKRRARGMFRRIMSATRNESRVTNHVTAAASTHRPMIDFGLIE